MPPVDPAPPMATATATDATMTDDDERPGGADAPILSPGMAMHVLPHGALNDDEPGNGDGDGSASDDDEEEAVPGPMSLRALRSGGHMVRKA